MSIDTSGNVYSSVGPMGAIVGDDIISVKFPVPNVYGVPFLSRMDTGIY